ncbi:MAG: hypothetical protein J0J04_07790 [Microbacterium sp.]|uniref:hypothetical protein n=1 Tax=Microbacterium sp. TaxID=51671 RepID=UPI001AD14454|nr:hypothetical protein [Microbacterium sp.]MBN9214700.1 hypothetical protein [Microbacterium sp.]
MTRTVTSRPVWVWKCDRCGREEHFASEQSGVRGLPSLDEMRTAGWHIADNFGDLCPACVRAGEGLIFGSIVRDGDPLPHVHFHTRRRTNLAYEPDEATVLSYSWEPRPEHSHAPIHEANPILDAIRADVRSRYLGDVKTWMAESIWPDIPFAYVAEHPDHLTHARRVLERLARAINVSLETP